jgi:hypothetical protein
MQEKIVTNRKSKYYNAGKFLAFIQRIVSAMQNHSPKINDLSCRSFSEGGSSFGNQLNP